MKVTSKIVKSKQSYSNGHLPYHCSFYCLGHAWCLKWRVHLRVQQRCAKRLNANVLKVADIWLLFDCRGLNPAECEVNFLKIVKNMDFYGVDMHSVVVSNLSSCTLIIIIPTFSKNRYHCSIIKCHMLLNWTW